MKWTSLNELREKYLSFFESKDHLRHKSFPLIPYRDKSLLLINAGMAPLKKYFTGELEPPRRRMTTCQKCIRTPDIERVGITSRHGTFFEMLGNFSFGDYFKKEAISWAWEFLTGKEWMDIPIDKLWVSIYLDDDEAHDFWISEANIDPDRIVRLGKEDNFWDIGSGPCGPDSEIFFDRGESRGCGSPDCKPGCDCDRYVEIWNLVFTQFDNDGEGNYTPLANKNIDTGMGLERLACMMQDVNNIFEVDTMQNIMKTISDKAGVIYGKNNKNDISLRVITDHIRSTCFLVCDGVVPSNEGRGYVLRRLLRRAARHGRLLGIEGTFLTDICDVVARENITTYPELTEKLDYIKKIVGIEEERFALTIDTGLNILSNIISEVKERHENLLSGSDVFKLNDTFGFSIDLTREIAEENGLDIDIESFQKLMKEQKDRARNARLAMGDLGWTDETFDFLGDLPVSDFMGYTDYTANSQILAIIDMESNEAIGTISDGKAILILDTTPFYAESGGQVGDTGFITGDGFTFTVKDTKKHNNIYLHIGEVKSGTITSGVSVTAAIDTEHRDAIRRNHSSVHLLQSALRKVLGNHVEQAGSYVDSERSRFDFTHFQALTSDEIRQVESIVNTEILKGNTISVNETDMDTAVSMGAIALFGEKYGETVRVIKMGDFSCELCGGTHLDNTAKMGLFKITSESSVAAGIRRIEATTGYGVLDLIYNRETLIQNTLQQLKVANFIDLPKRAEQLQNEYRTAKHEIEKLNTKLAAAQIDELLKDMIDVDGLKVITRKTNGMSIDILRTLGDELKARFPEIVAVISVDLDDKLNFIGVCGKYAVARGAHAGNILKQVSEITGGKGGGRPDSATSGGKDHAEVDNALSAVADIVRGMLR